jgi:hypothetical protein
MNLAIYIGWQILDPLTVALVGCALLISSRWWMIPLVVVGRYVAVGLMYEIINEPWAFRPVIQLIVSIVQVLVIYLLINGITALIRHRN